MENVRYNISPCSKDEAQAFVSSIDTGTYESRGAVMADGRSHYDRYSYIRDEQKVAVVYDTTACVISITAPGAFADDLLAKFVPTDKTIKRSTVPAQGGKPLKPKQSEPSDKSTSVIDDSGDVRAKFFVAPDTIKRRHDALKTQTVIATAKGLEISTDEIFPPQRVKPRIVTPQKPKYSGLPDVPVASDMQPRVLQSEPVKSYYSGTRKQAKPQHEKASSVEAYFAGRADASSEPASVTPRPRRATISFGDSDDYASKPKKTTQIPRGAGTGLFAEVMSAKSDEQKQPEKHAAVQTIAPVPSQPQVQKRKRGRPRKNTGATADIVQPLAVREGKPEQEQIPEYKNGYSVKNFETDKLNTLLKRMRAGGYAVKADGIEFPNTPQEVITHTISDGKDKVTIRYAANKKTVQLQGRQSELFGEVQAAISLDTDYNSALENYGNNDGTDNKLKVAALQKRLKRRLPVAYGYLSEPSRIDFSYAIHDFERTLEVFDYSGPLVPLFRGLEQFISDLQRAENINVKMIGQAYDKDENGRYILKKGYAQRIGSIVYCEVMVSLYTSYFMFRNFILHADNTASNITRSITDRTEAKKIFDEILDTVEYNARKLQEIRFTIR